VQKWVPSDFSRDNINMYAPYNNNSVAINTNTDSIDDYIAVLDKILRYKFYKFNYVEYRLSKS
jgi:hypothetical protein